MHVAHKNTDLIQQRKEFEKLTMPIFEELGKYDISQDRAKAIFDYTTDIYSRLNKISNPHKVSNARIVRKVVEHFHLKLKG